MELYAMIFERLTTDDELEELLTSYDRRPAVFYQRPATPDDEHWSNRAANESGQTYAIQYPRIDYTVDLQENPARNTGGVLTLNVWCDAWSTVEPETIESRLRELLHTAFAQTDDYAYCLAWLRSDAFEIRNKTDESVRTFGVTVLFDLMACPCQYTLYPDPIKGMNAWTKKLLPNAIVIGEDEIDGWLVPTREQPVIYWRVTAQAKSKQTFICTWLNITIEGHVYCHDAADRLYNLIKINAAFAIEQHITLEDSSPLFLTTFDVQPHLNYITTGQIRASGYFGLLQPESHFSTNATGEKLNHANVECRIIDDADVGHRWDVGIPTKQSEA